MIYVQDDYLGAETFKAIQEYVNESEFQIINIGGKEFSAIETPQAILPLLDIQGYELILTFRRKAYKGFDNEMRIHSDNIINGNKTEIASVLYLNDDKGITPNGTAFYKHKKHGHKLDKESSKEEFNKILEKDANDLSKWEELDRISARPNRNLTYNANYFHSKFPKEIEKGERIVMVSFYKEAT